MHLLTLQPSVIITEVNEALDKFPATTAFHHITFVSFSGMPHMYCILLHLSGLCFSERGTEGKRDRAFGAWPTQTEQAPAIVKQGGGQWPGQAGYREDYCA